MAKTTSFPVKSFEIRGSALSERERVKVVRDTMTGKFTWALVKGPKKTTKAKGVAVKKAAKKVAKPKLGALKLERTATGSGRVKFSFETRPKIVTGTSSRRRA